MQSSNVPAEYTYHGTNQTDKTRKLKLRWEAAVIIIITFTLIQEIGFTESLLNWKTLTGPNSAQLLFLYVTTQTLETVNVDLELDYLQLLKTTFINYT